jgi:hypothetical protein
VTGQRKALIVANDEYEHAGLKHLRAPAADAQALAGVLRDTRIGNFDVRVVRNEPSHVIEGHIEDILSETRPDDVLLLHFSCHGLKSESGELFFATRNTRPNRLGSTAISADFVQRCMRASRSRSIVLLLDCCYGGAFSQGVTVRASGDVNVLDSFAGERMGGGRGRAVITASSAMEYAFEGDQLADEHSQRPSVFTSALVEGLATGDADRDQDGWVSLNELYDYVFDRVREQNPHQTPSRDVQMQGEFYLARRSRPVTTPAPLPPELQEVVDHPLAGIRAGAVQELANLLQGRHAGLALAGKMALERLADDDSRMVAARARAALATTDSDEGVVLEPLPRESEPPPAARDAPTAARLELSSYVLDFEPLAQGGEPARRTVRLGNAGGGTLHARATTSVSWLDLHLVDDQLAVVVNTTTVGDYDGIITVDSNGGAADIRVLATVIAPTIDDQTYIIQPENASPVGAPGPSTTEAPEIVNRREHIGSRSTFGVPASDPAEPDEIRPPTGAHRPPDRHHRLLSTRARVLALAGTGCALTLILIVVLSVKADTDRTTSAGPTMSTDRTTSTGPTTARTQQTYTAPGGISITTDKGWTLDGPASTPNLRDYRAPGSASKTTGTYLRIGIEDNTPASSLVRELKTASDSLTGPDSPYRDVIIVHKQLTEDTCGSPAAGVEFTGTNQAGVLRHAIERLMISGGTAKILQLNTPNTEWDPTHALLNQLIASCRIV